jgi:O-antigen/teichoic acid export membrane protein
VGDRALSDLIPTEVEGGGSGTGFAWLDRSATAVLRLILGSDKKRLSNRVLLAAQGSLWAVAGYSGSQLLRFATQLVLARKLLGPQAFGLVALVSVFLSGLEMLSDLGIGLDVIQHPRGDDPRFINTAFLIQAGRGVILFGLAAALAYPFARFYHQPAVRWMIFVAALSVGLRGLASGSIWTITRHVQLHKLTVLNLGSDLAGFLVSVAWALISPTAWALVVGRVASSAVYVLVSHFIGDERVSLDWDSKGARDILMFGSGIFLSSATYFMSGEAERLIMGKLITVAELGCFALALTLSSAPSQALSQVVGQVFFPMISQSLREDPDKAARDFKRARTAFLVAGVCVGTLFIAYGPRIVAVLLPPKFAMTGWMLQWLGFRGAQQVFVAPTSNLVLACGDSKYPAISNTVRFALMSVGLWISFTRYGVHAAIAVLAISSFLAYFVLFPALARYMRKAFWFEVSSVLIFLGCMALAAVVPLPFR